MQEPPRPGETIYKGHRSYDLMRNLQMGILFSIAKTNKEVSGRNLNPTPTELQDPGVPPSWPGEQRLKAVFLLTD